MLYSECRDRVDKEDIRKDWPHCYPGIENHLKNQIITSIWSKLPSDLLTKEQAEKLAVILADGSGEFLKSLDFKMDHKYRLIVLLDDSAFEYLRKAGYSL